MAKKSTNKRYNNKNSNNRREKNNVTINAQENETKNNQAEQKSQASNVIKEKNKNDEQNDLVKILELRNEQAEQKTPIIAIQENAQDGEAKIAEVKDDEKDQQKLTNTTIKQESKDDKEKIVEEDPVGQKTQTCIFKEDKDAKQSRLTSSSKLKQENEQEQNFSIVGLSDKIYAKKEKIQIIEKVINDIQEQKSFSKVVTKIIEDEDKNTIITIARNLKYFITSENKNNKAENTIIHFLIFECCSRGKLSILKKLQIVFKINFEDFSREFHQRKKEKIDLLTVAAQHQQLEIIKFLLEEKSLFLCEQKDKNTTLINYNKITEKVIDFQIPFIQYALVSNYSQSSKLKFTEILLDFIKSLSATNKEEVLIINYLIYHALRNSACEALNYVMTYAQTNRLKIETWNQGLFSKSNIKPSANWLYKTEVDMNELAKVVGQQQKVDCSKHLENMFHLLKQNKGQDKDYFTEAEVMHILKQAQIFIEGKNNSINALLTKAVDDNSSEQIEEVNAGGAIAQEHD